MMRFKRLTAAIGLVCVSLIANPADARKHKKNRSGSEQRSTEGPRTSCATECEHAPLFADHIELTELDREVLALCPDNSEGSVSRENVRRFVSAHIEDERLQTALSQAGRSGDRSAQVDWLVSLWVDTGPRNAFTHIFCGDDWQRRDIGGLHWLPRYARLENEGKICFDGYASRSTQPAGQYLIRFHGVSPWSCAQKPLGGFALEHDPITLFALATRAFVGCCDRDRHNAGIFVASDLSTVSWQIFCGSRNGGYGIDSFYPVDRRPTCGRGVKPNR